MKNEIQAEQSDKLKEIRERIRLALSVVYASIAALQTGIGDTNVELLLGRCCAEELGHAFEELNALLGEECA